MKLQHFFHIILAGAATGFITFTSFLPTVRAETLVTDGYLQVDTVWNAEHSPYILGDTVTVPEGVTLRIEPGVEIIADPASLYDPYIYVNGSIVARGTPESPVRIGNIWGITIDHGRGDISQAVFNMKGSLSFVVAEGDISSTTITNTVDGTVSDGVSVQNSTVSIRGSTIEGNSTGIRVEDSDGIFQAKSGKRFLGLINVAHAIEFGPSQVNITGSRLLNNTQASVFNNTELDVHAIGNWWGDESGPQYIPRDELDLATVAGNVVSGPVAYDPWLQVDPMMEIETKPCCSSVIFIPGLQASRLYKDQTRMFGIGTSENQLWEPNRNADVQKLFLNADGTSIDTEIFAGEPISKAYGLVGVYDSFMSFLDDLRDEGKIAEWKSFGYDWRKPVTEVVAGNVARATTTESLVATVEEVASRSQTGKVSVIAHSNGGLVTKQLVKTLAEMGKGNLIDTVVSVAVPHIGTPQSIPALLHGDSQSILGGVILKKSIAKELGINMPSAYGLLPSATYFSKVFGPTIAYASTTSAPPVDTASLQDSFVSARANGLLVNLARGLHSILDPFSWPATIAHWAIVGWGNVTTKGIKYTDDSLSKYEKLTTEMGDGTVVAPSAAFNAGITTSVDLVAVSENEDTTIKHSNILEATATQDVIENIIVGKNVMEGDGSVEESISKIPGVTIGEPDYNKDETFLVVSTHSPVELHLYDSRGRHSGIAPLPSLIAEQVEEGLLTFVENNIPGSSVDIQGDEEDPTTYITIPEKSGQNYKVVVKGIGIGDFTYRVDRTDGENVLQRAEYSGLPVTPFMVASSTVVTGAETKAPLKIDIDGNGSVDVSAQANTVLDPAAFFEAFKKTVVALLGTSKQADDIVKRIDKVIDAFKKDKTKKIDIEADKFIGTIGSKKLVGITDHDRAEIIKIMEDYIKSYE